MQKRLNSETGVNKSFENAPCQGRIYKFFEGEDINFRLFFQAHFSDRVIFKQLIQCSQKTLTKKKRL